MFSITYVKLQMKIFKFLQPPKNWTGGVGFITKDMIKEHCPASGPRSTKILLCGPPPMIKAMTQHCQDLGFGKANTVSKTEDSVFKF